MITKRVLLDYVIRLSDKVDDIEAAVFMLEDKVKEMRRQSQVTKEEKAETKRRGRPHKQA